MDEEKRPASPADSEPAAGPPRPSLLGQGRRILTGGQEGSASDAPPPPRAALPAEATPAVSATPPHRSRPSMRGMGRRVLGPPAAAVSPHARVSLSSAEVEAAPLAEVGPLAPVIEAPPVEAEALEVVPLMGAPARMEEYAPPPVLEALTPGEPEVIEAEALPLDEAGAPAPPVEVPPVEAEALEVVPLMGAPARMEEYAPPPVLEALTPGEPEVIEAEALPLDEVEAPAPVVELPPAPVEPVLAAAVETQPVEAIPEPGLEMFGEPEPRVAPEVWPYPMRPPDSPPPAGAGAHITAEAVGRLVVEMEALQEQIVERAGGLDGNAVVYQQELAYASYWLHQSLEYFDAARAIVYRVRADLRRAANVRAWSQRYAGPLLFYLALVAAGVVVLGLTREPVLDAAARAGASPEVVAAYMPGLFGALGALFAALWVLIDQFFVARDFEPAYVPWYLLAPYAGLIVGVVLYGLLYAGALVLRNAGVHAVISETLYPLWALSFVAGAAALLIWRRPGQRRESEHLPPHAAEQEAGFE